MRLDDITIVVPTRNEAHNIGAFVGALPDAVPLIVVDSGDDATPDLVQALRPFHTTLLRREGNVTQARQWGAQAAKTSWLLFTDADVVFAPGYFDRLQRYVDCDALYGPKLSTDQFTRYCRWFTWVQGLSHRLGIPAASGSNLLVKRSVFNEIGGFDLELTCNEDSEIFWRIKRQG